MTRHRRLALLCVGALTAGLGFFAPQPVVVVAEEAVVDSSIVTLGPADPAEPAPAEAGPEAPHEHLDEPGPGPEAARARARREVETFDALGVTVDGAPPSELVVRGRIGGTWTPWYPVTFVSDEGPDHAVEPTRPGRHSQLVWLGAADAYELDAPTGTTDLQVHLVRQRVAQRTVVVSEPAVGAVGPAIAGRDTWGARPPARRPGTTVDLKMAVVHHSVNGNGYSAAQVPSMIRSIQAYHMDVNGWDDIAYNFVVDRFGRAWEGRAGGTDRAVLGGHSAGFNSSSTGVVVLGDFTSSSAPAAAVEAVAQVIAWKFMVHQVDPRSAVPYTTTGSSKYAAGTTVLLERVIGHRDVQTTSCPGAQLYGRIGHIRSRVAALVDDYRAHGPTVLLPLRHRLSGLTDVLQARAGGGGDLWWRATGTGTVRQEPANITGAYHAVTGDFDGNGFADVLWHGRGTAPDSIWWSGPGSYTSEPLTVSGSYLPVVGDFDGNGVDDVLWYGPGPNPDSVWYFQRDRTRTSRSVTQNLITAQPLAGDFDGDDRTDVFWYGPGSGADDHLWTSTGMGFASRSISVNGYFVPAVASVDGDGADDVVWVSETGVGSSLWEFADGGGLRSRPLPDSAAGSTPHIGDFDGDGHDDVLVYAAGPAQDAVWFGAAGSTTRSPVSVNGSYLVSAGRTHAARPNDDILFVAPSGPDHLWSGRGDRTFSSTRVG